MSNALYKTYVSTDVTILAAPFGFGPLGKALAIAHELEERGITVKILGDHTAQKIISRSRIIGGMYEYRKPLDLKDLKSRIVLSCLDVSTPIIKSDVPLILVDSLFWLRGMWERSFEYNADYVLAQRFFVDAPQDAQKTVAARLHMVDAILPASSLDPKLNNNGELIVLYPGGMRSPYLGLDYQEKYLSWGVGVVSESMKATGIDPSNFVVITPPQLLGTTVVGEIKTFGGRVETCVTDLGYLLRDARCLVLAPGIEIMLEACSMGKIPHFIPAFNGSHIPQLMAYREARIGKEVCPSYADELRQLEVNTDNLSRLSVDVERRNFELLTMPAYQNEAISNLITFLKTKESLKNCYPLGKYGAKQVVNFVLDKI